MDRRTAQCGQLARRDSAMRHAVDWALERSDLPPAKHLLLVGLAWIADADGVTFKGQQEIARRMGRDPRWVREHVAGLAKAGVVTRYRRHRQNGSRTTDLLVLNWPREQPLDLSAYSGIVGDREPGDAAPAGEGVRAPTGGNPPGGLPAETCTPTGGNPPGPRNLLNNLGPNGPSIVRPPAREPVRTRVAERGLTPDQRRIVVALRAVADAKSMSLLEDKALEACLKYPGRDFAHEAEQLSHWHLHGNGMNRRQRDLTAQWRNWLRQAPPAEQRAARQRQGGASAEDFLRIAERG